MFDHIGRVEIRTGVGARRRWTENQKASIVAESFAPGAVVSEVARRHEISPQHLFQWRKAAKAGQLVLPMGDEPMFAEVVLKRPEPQVVAPLPGIDIEVAGAIIHFRLGCDLGLLTAVVRALKAAA